MSQSLSMLQSVEAAGAPGALVLVVGPSGAGKDTLMEQARAALGPDPRFVFVRRLITRPAMAGAEDHDSCSEAEFEAARARGELVLSWQAHGLSYGIPASIQGEIDQGRVVIANLSRVAIPQAEHLAGRVVVLNITAPAEILAARLAARGRESEADIRQRLAREAALQTIKAELVTVSNDRSVAEGAAAVLAVLRGLANHEAQAL